MLTKTRNLRNGRSVWQGNSAAHLPTQRCPDSLATDVLVVGAGISGAMIADLLSEAGLQVTVVDKRGLAQGSTPASTALLQYEIDLPLTELSRRIGNTDAVRAWRRARLALDGLSARLRGGHITPVQPRDSLYLAGNLLDPAGLRAEAEARRNAGFENLYLDAPMLAERFGILRDGALLSYDNLAVDPSAMTHGFLAAAAARGAALIDALEIVDMSPAADHVLARGDAGQSIRARHVIFATGYERPFAIAGKGHSIGSTWAIATRPQPEKLWPERCFIWEASSPYLYLRTTPEGRIICGGEDEPISDGAIRDTLTPAKTQKLREKLSQLMPEVDTTPDYAWSGAFGLSETGLPSIGEIPHMPGCWAVLAYGGNGITFSRIAAEIIRSALTGTQDPDAELFGLNSDR